MDFSPHPHAQGLALDDLTFRSGERESGHRRESLRVHVRYIICQQPIYSQQVRRERWQFLGDAWTVQGEAAPSGGAYELKGQSHEIYCCIFCHQSVHSGPIRDVL